MDLNTLDIVAAADRGAVLNLRHPINGSILKDEEGSTLDVTLMGRDSREFRAAQHRIAERRVRRRKGHRMPEATISPEQLEEDELDLLASVTRSFSTNITLDGKPILTRQDYVLAYGRFPWVKEQVDSFIIDRSAFLGEALTPSLPTPESTSDWNDQ